MGIKVEVLYMIVSTSVLQCPAVTVFGAIS